VKNYILRIQLSLFVGILIHLPLASAHLVTNLSKSNESYKYNQYYVISKPSSEIILAPVLLNQFDQVTRQFPVPTEKYNREKHFGGWIKPDANSCLNTRGLVLKRDSKVEIPPTTGCYIKTGEWHDPYTDQIFTSASDIQIDHMVPLKNAYMTGAFEWDSKKRCLYANYLGNKFHLIAVSGHENEEKSDKSPAEYTPPNRSYQCEYIRNWLAIKYIWELRLTPYEVSAIQREIQSNNCQAEDLEIDSREIQNQRKYIQDNKDLCH